MSRERRRGRPGPASTAANTGSGGPGWRATVSSFGGLTVIGLGIGLVVVIVAAIWFNRPASISESALLGEAITIGPATHVATVAEMSIQAGQPPVGGPHLPRWLAAGIFDEPVSDGLAVHSLEHGLIWVTYNPNRITPGDLATLKDVARDFGRDVMLSPRPDNASVIAVASWGRLLTLERADRNQIKKFIETNRDRSPEPGVR